MLFLKSSFFRPSGRLSALILFVALAFVVCLSSSSNSLVSAEEVATDAAAATASETTSTSTTTTSTTESSSSDEVELETTDAPDEEETPATKGKKPKIKNKKPIELTRNQFCIACQSVVEEFHKWTVSQFYKGDEKSRHKEMSRSDLLEWFCRSPPFNRFKEPYMWGCIKAIQDHHDVVLAPFIGTHESGEFSTLNGVYNHRREACAKIDACDPVQPQPRPKNDCESCDRLVNDLYWVLWRENQVNATVTETLMGSVCMEIGMRHEKTVDLEAFCHEHLDEHFKTLKVEIPALWNDPEQPDKRGALRTLLCGGLTGSCREERQKYKDDQKKKKEEIKRKKNEAQKERRRQREAQKSGSDKPKEEL